MEAQPEKKKHPGGRPSKFTNKIADEICYRLATGESLRHICEDENLPDRVTVMRWLNNTDEEKKEFRIQYARAREIQAEYIFEDILDIANDGRNDWMENKWGDEVVNNEVVQRSKLRVDTLKWYISKVLPKKFGEQKTGNVNVIINISERIKEARNRIDPALRVFSERET